MTCYRFLPLDPLFLRGGRPFAAGEESWTETFFLPFPSVFYGALGALLFVQKEFTPEKIKAGLRIHGFFLACPDEIYLPVPLDLITEKDNGKRIQEKGESKAYLPILQERRGYLTNLPDTLGLVLTPDYANLKEAGEIEGLVGSLDFFSYLRGRRNYSTCYPFSRFTVEEAKIGIKRDRQSFSAEEHMLYRADFKRYLFDKKSRDFNRWEKLSFLVDCSGELVSRIPFKGITKLGGEGKGVLYEKVDYPEELNSLREGTYLAEVGELNRFKLVFLTPVIWEKGWLPGWLDEETLTGEYQGIRVRLLACVTGRALSIGGWDLAAKRPKPMCRALPAGAVYCFEVTNDIPGERIREAFHYRNLSDFRAEEGFGLAVVGVVS
ncbi:MAG: type III-B CRISPR module-associated protein Cmr3 [Armatimonadetes bacterium]|nr:type III-B CRISPR module-associated protein Cmr3 [Armatimonadota bacterium]